jgi:hypothetical protein
MSSEYDLVIATPFASNNESTGKRRRRNRVKRQKRRKRGVDKLDGKERKHESKKRKEQIERALKEEEKASGKDNEDDALIILKEKTEAERQFEERFRQREEKLIKDIAKVSHRDKVDKLYQRLDRLPTHFDIGR